MADVIEINTTYYTTGTEEDVEANNSGMTTVILEPQ